MCTRAPAFATDSTAIFLRRMTERMRERDVRDEPVPEERADPPARPIEELIRHDDVERLDVLAQAADGARRDESTRRRAS